MRTRTISPWKRSVNSEIPNYLRDLENAGIELNGTIRLVQNMT